MLDQVPGGTAAHGIEHHIDTFPSRQFCSGDEISVSCYHYNLIHLVLEGHGRDIKAKAHVYTFLNDIEFKVIICEFDRSILVQPCLPRFVFQAPCEIIVQTPQTKSDLANGL